jgi:hypothetical protein
MTVGGRRRELVAERAAFFVQVEQGVDSGKPLGGWVWIIAVPKAVPNDARTNVGRGWPPRW